MRFFHLLLLLGACQPDPAKLAEGMVVCQQAIDRKVTTIPLHECAEGVAFLRDYTGDEVLPCMAMNRPMYCQSLDDGSIQTFGRGMNYAKVYSVENSMQMPVVY